MFHRHFIALALAAVSVASVSTGALAETQWQKDQPVVDLGAAHSQRSEDRPDHPRAGSRPAS